jgi:LmbE family N-acetylglucosaminyl deacetylase
MIPFQLDKLQTVLCIGAHADDIEIGCGGTMLEMLAACPSLKVYWVVLSAAGPRHGEALQSAERFLEAACEREIMIEGFRDSYFPYEGTAVKDFMQRLRKIVSPDLVFTHRREDMHQDHRLVAELTWNAFRDHLILEYEIPKYEGDLGTANVLTPLSQPTCRRKIETIVDSFPSQQDKPWFSPDTLWALLRLRGVECHSPSSLAEGFYCRKAIFSPVPAARDHLPTEAADTAICLPADLDASLRHPLPVTE